MPDAEMRMVFRCSRPLFKKISQQIIAFMTDRVTKYSSSSLNADTRLKQLKVKEFGQFSAVKKSCAATERETASEMLSVSTLMYALQQLMATECS